MFGDFNMAKKAAKTIKKTVKATKSSLRKLSKASVEEGVKDKVEAEISHAETVAKSSVKKIKGNSRATIEKLSSDGHAQAAHIWKHIKDHKDMSEGEIKSLINSKNFFGLLGKLA